MDSHNTALFQTFMYIDEFEQNKMEIFCAVFIIKTYPKNPIYNTTIK